MGVVVIAILLGVLLLAIPFGILFAWMGRQTKFIKQAKSIQEGMDVEKVFEILGSPTMEEKEDNKYIYLWEKLQWKGHFRGGTLVRSIKVVCVENKVVSIARKNLDASVWW